MNALIDFDKLRIVKLVPSIQQAEYWAALLCKRCNFGIHQFTPEKLVCLTPRDLNGLYQHMAPGVPFTAKNKLELAVRIVSAARSDSIDDTPVEVLVRKLGKTLPHADGDHNYAGDKTAPSGTLTTPQQETKETSMPRKKAETPETPAKKVKAPKAVAQVERVEQNGIVRPRAGGKCARVWEIADTISKKTRKPAELAAILEVTDAEELNPGNTRVEYQRWRRFNGLTTAQKSKAA